MHDPSLLEARAGERKAGHRFHLPPLDRREVIGVHVILRLADDRPIATTATAQRTVARVVLAQGETRGLLAFGAADDHLHAELVTDRASAGAFALYTESALRWHLGLGVPFERARVRPLHDQRHAYHTFHYAHRQDVRHVLGLDGARDATSLPDLLGLRVVAPSLRTRVRAHLPKIRREDLTTHLPESTFDESKPILLDVLSDAAAAAFALPELRGRSSRASQARHAAIHAMAPEVSSEELASCLAIGVRAVQACRSRPAPDANVRAVRGQARLRAHLLELNVARTRSP